MVINNTIHSSTSDKYEADVNNYLTAQCTSPAGNTLGVFFVQLHKTFSAILHSINMTIQASLTTITNTSWISQLAITNEENTITQIDVFYANCIV